MDCSTPGFPVHHQLPEPAQTHVHQVHDVILPSHPLSSPSLPAFNLSQHQGLFKWVSSSHQVAKVLEFQLQYQSFQWIFMTNFLRIDSCDLFAVQGTLKSLLQHYSSKAYEVVKPEMAKVNINILGMNELKWTRMGEFNSDDHYIYYRGQGSLTRNGVALIVKKRVWNVVLGCNLKNSKMISIHFQGKPFNITVIQIYAPTTNAEEAEVEWFSEDLQDLLELTPKKYVFFIMERKSRKSRATWSNRQIWPWNTEWSRAKNNRVLPRKCTGHSKRPLPTTQEKTLHMDNTRGSTLKSDWLYSLQPKMEKLYTVSKNKTRSWLWLRPWTPYCQIQT